MFITFREKSIIELIVRTSGKHTVHSLSSYLDVSARTIQRDLKSIEKTLQEFDLTIERTVDEGLLITGPNDQIYRLIQNLITVSPADETPEERKLKLLIILLHEGPFFKKQVLAGQLGISNATLSAHLDDLSDWLQKFSVQLSRTKGVGIEVDGREANKRHALGSFMLAYFYEEIIESLYFLQQGRSQKENILGYFFPQYLTVVDRLVKQKINQEQIKLADSDYVGLVVYSCMTLQRAEKGFLLETLELVEKSSTSEYQLIENVCKELSEQLSVQLSIADTHFLSVILKGSKVQAANSSYYDSVLLGRKVKNLIRNVSSQLGVDLIDDFSLYQGLLAHMEPLIFRLNQNLESFNPLTDEIKRKYPVLFMAVKQGMENEFESLNFSADETAFVVLHFGSALLMGEEKIQIDAVIICPSGIGTSKMLASRIQKELPEINSVKILSIKDFQAADFKDYDLVISTIRLPVTEVDYIRVSPLLNERDIGYIESYLQNNVKKITGKTHYLNREKTSDTQTTKNRPNIQQMLQEIKQVQHSMDVILSNFKVVRQQFAADHWEILQEVLEMAKKDGVVTNVASAMSELKERENKGGLGIPETTMALYHCRDESVQELLFQIIHLDNPLIVKGMDGKDMQMKHLLLMLAPTVLTDRQQEILSLISTSLIENNQAMMIFTSSNEKAIRQKLEEIFLEYLQNNLIKE
ncbi:Mannitol operon activator, BglG family [Planococcus halocryophilus Or1]|uniref:Sugar transporter n=1 Tax=Planococcus halocryophilus TaxID=1215089 RepID=A0A1C7DSK1_9BACL|nr:PRD domain-containing protein [Planococcus halocryophilus]ANU14579.1 sugar transporter [Planococcus halocryophilus]EMF46752.1 Mannitol operon activator, BglG family [Planococcus halocryophilus Or1]